LKVRNAEFDTRLNVSWDGGIVDVLEQSPTGE